MATIKTNQKEAKEKLAEVLKELGFDIQEEVSLCLSDIPKDHMSKAKNGKIYINITIAMRKEPDQWGRDLKVYMTPTKEDRANKTPKMYVGGGKTFIFAENQADTPTDDEINNLIPPPNVDKKDGLPF